MRRVLLWFAVISPFWLGVAAKADPMTLTLSGMAFGVPIHETVDVTNGFAGLNIPLTDTPLAVLQGATPTGPSAGAINSTFGVFAGLTGVNGNASLSANELLSGTIQGSYSFPPGDPDPQGGVSGSATAQNLVLSPGLSADAVPSWFTGLSAQISGTVTGGGEGLLLSTLLIPPGSSSATSSPQVPEPSTLIVFLASMVALGVDRRRRARRT